MERRGERVELVLGPILRYAGTESATFWVETSAPCDVEVLGRRTRTFAVEGHHFALLLVGDLEPASVIAYDVRLDGHLVWPHDDGRPAPAVHTRGNERRVRLAFGSCRVGDPEPVSTGSPWPDDLVRTGIDALWAYARQLQRGELEWPDALLLLGDQVYADEVSPDTSEFIRAKRDVREPPGEQIADFEEFTRLYRESWSDPDIRWLLSTVPSVMIFDDHDVNDDWNISSSWVSEMRGQAWWDDRITGAFMSYWIYQHIGNLSPPELEEQELLRLVCSDSDAGPRLRREARRWDRESAASRWAYYRDFGDSRLLVLDSRAARVLGEESREMIDEEEWDWVIEHSVGDFDHLVIASTLPVFLPRGIHHLEAWNEAVCAGRWGRWAAKTAERLRRAVDLEHWSAFNTSFERLCDWLREVSEGAGTCRPPATIVLLGGDVHNAYVSEIALGNADGTSSVFQIVCSPFRNPLAPKERRTVKLTGSRGAALTFSFLARLAGVRPTSAGWRFLRRPTFDNSIGELELDARNARVTLRRSGREGETADVLHLLHATELRSDATRATRDGSGGVSPPVQSPAKLEEAMPG
jgi:phosphodiesterase/alkaline phosphatase D-like protein